MIVNVFTNSYPVINKLHDFLRFYNGDIARSFTFQEWQEFRNEHSKMMIMASSKVEHLGCNRPNGGK